jgi:acetylornithine deacetylase/succinyl-diaminopimelate desuccinylase-like protein
MRTLDARATGIVSAPADVRHLWARLASARAALAADDEAVLREQIALSRIPAPTGSETARGLHVAARFRALGLRDVRVDEVGNVCGTRPGAGDGAPVVICAHLDTVFPAGADVSVRRDGDHLLGPGIVDNARGLAGMLALARVIDGVALRTRRPILFVATVGEEGSGDLRGAKHLFAKLQRVPACCIALDGAGDDRIVHRALGARRFRITYRGAGGHSWAAYGVSNPVHAAGAAAARLAALPLPREPRTTLSVCRIGGGISVNSIPEEAWLEVDLRSSSAEVLAGCVADIRAAVHMAAREENSRRAPGTEPLTYDVAMIGDRPCGATAEHHALVRIASEATRAIGRVPELVTASTDANVPISLGIPAIAIGAGGRGGGVHTPGEWYANVDGTLGLVRALAIVAAAADIVQE